MERDRTNDSPKRPFKNVPIYMAFFCGLAALAIGIYMYIKDFSSTGINKGREVTINGASVIIMALIFIAFPTYILLKVKK